MEESIAFNLNTVILYGWVKERVGCELLESFEEPEEGNPPSMRIQGKWVTQDLLYAVLDYCSIRKGIQDLPIASVMELGAGYGRTAYVMLKMQPSLKYIIVDIPPALWIAQTYLTETLAAKRVFKYRRFDSWAKIEKEFKEADMAFLMPDQLAKIPDKSVDMFLAIDNLHAMRREQVSAYFAQVERLARLFYFSCANVAKVPRDGFSWRAEEFPIRESWKLMYEEFCVVPDQYRNYMYDVSGRKETGG